MYVNAFWFGVLLTVIFLIVLIFNVAFFSWKRSETEEEEDEEKLLEEYKELMRDVFRDVLREFQFGKSVEDRDNE